ncbi:MAG: hypothetical protein ABH873_10080 [Candidatus Firestonebacteria bacterium]
MINIKTIFLMIFLMSCSKLGLAEYLLKAGEMKYTFGEKSCKIVNIYSAEDLNNDKSVEIACILDSGEVGIGFNEGRAVCWRESSFRQFDSRPGPDWPYFTGPNGWGLMQLDNPAATEREIWHWSDNLTRGIKYLNACRTSAQNYLNTWYDISVKNGTPWSWNPKTEHSDWVWNDGFARYGPSTKPTLPGDIGKTIYNHNGDRDCTFRPVECNYSSLVRGHVNNKPWNQ